MLLCLIPRSRRGSDAERSDGASVESPPKLFRSAHASCVSRLQVARTAKMPKFVPRQRKHKVIARRKASSHSNGETNDANTEEILPQEVKDRAEQKRVLKDELLRDAQGKISGKKKKRLDKYIVRVDMRLATYFLSSAYISLSEERTNYRRIPS